MRWVINKPEGIDSASPQHQIMAEHYRDIIEQAIREFDNSFSNEIYKNLAWVGLQGTVAWNNLSQQERDSIEDTVDNFRDTNHPCSN